MNSFPMYNYYQLSQRPSNKLDIFCAGIKKYSKTFNVSEVLVGLRNLNLRFFIYCLSFSDQLVSLKLFEYK